MEPSEPTYVDFIVTLNYLLNSFYFAKLIPKSKFLDFLLQTLSSNANGKGKPARVNIKTQLTRQTTELLASPPKLYYSYFCFLIK